MAEPVAGVPAWHPDPTGRHQHRWWDGAAFTDQVADSGTIATDDGTALPAWGAPVPQPIPPPVGPAGAASAAPARHQRRGALVAGLAVLAAAGAASIWYFVLAPDGGGTGTFTGRAAPDDIGVHEVSIDAGSALTVEVVPGDDLDAVVGLVVSTDDAERIDDLYEDLGVAASDLDEAFPAVERELFEQFGDDAVVVFRTDVGFAGEGEDVLLALPFSIEAHVVVAPFGDDDADDYEVRIDGFGLDVDDDADAEELLDAVVDDGDLPASARRLAEDLLALLA